MWKRRLERQEQAKICTYAVTFITLFVHCTGFEPSAVHRRMRTPLPAYLSQKPRDKTIFPLDTSVLRSVATPSAALAGIDKPVRPMEALAPTVFNFAFGSNLNPEKRSSRGVNGTGIVSRDCYPAVVKGFRLAFNLPMFPPVEPGMAALARAREGEDDSCHGLLLELSNEEYQKLWASEGGMAQKPPYEETVVEAETYDGRKIRAIAFTAAAHTCASYELPPSARYKDLVVKGARASGLDANWIAHLQAIPAARPTAPAKVLATCYLALSAVLFRFTGGFSGIKPRVRGAGNAISMRKKLFSRRGLWAMAAHVAVKLRLAASVTVRHFTTAYRDLLKAAYRVSLPGGSLSLPSFPSQAASRKSSSGMVLRRVVSELLICFCLLPGAVLGLITACCRACLGKNPFPSMMGGGPSKKKTKAT